MTHGRLLVRGRVKYNISKVSDFQKKRAKVRSSKERNKAKGAVR